MTIVTTGCIMPRLIFSSFFFLLSVFCLSHESVSLRLAW